jgi:ABC-type lipoprotein export system ATPase subunit
MLTKESAPTDIPNGAIIDKLLVAYGGNRDRLIADINKRSLRTSTQNSTNNTRRKNGDTIIKLENLNKSYGKVDVLKNINLEITEGEFVAITGASGNGKSTLMHLMGGLDKPSSGEITVAGQNIKKLKDRNLSKFRNKTIGFVFQFFYLQPFMNLRKNIEIACMPVAMDKANRQKRTTDIALAVGLTDKLNYFPRQLSGGQMQRAAIARSIVNSPKIILADEPTGNLDSDNSHAIINLFRHICETQGTTIVLVTHDLSLANKTDRIIEIIDGEIR